MSQDFIQSDCQDFRQSLCQNRETSPRGTSYVFSFAPSNVPFGSYPEGFTITASDAGSKIINGTVNSFDIPGHKWNVTSVGTLCNVYFGHMNLVNQDVAGFYSYNFLFHISGNPDKIYGTIAYHPVVSSGILGPASFSQLLNGCAPQNFTPPGGSAVVWWIGIVPADLPVSNFNPNDYNLKLIPEPGCS